MKLKQMVCSCEVARMDVQGGKGLGEESPKIACRKMAYQGEEAFIPEYPQPGPRDEEEDIKIA